MRYNNNCNQTSQTFNPAAQNANTTPNPPNRLAAPPTANSVVGNPLDRSLHQKQGISRGLTRRRGGGPYVENPKERMKAVVRKRIARGWRSVEGISGVKLGRVACSFCVVALASLMDSEGVEGRTSRAA